MSELLTASNLLVILGPTASGKTRLAVALAEQYGGEIISADSRQVFCGMDIGSGKDLHEYRQTPYHLIDILPAGGEFSVFQFQRNFYRVYEDVVSRGALPVLCGGSGLYLDAILRGYRMIEVPANHPLRCRLADKSQDELVAELRHLRPELHNSTDLVDRERTLRAIEIATAEDSGACHDVQLPLLRPLVLGIRWERDELRRRITDRLRQRLDNGMIEEVEQLHAGGIEWQRLDYYGLEYRYVGAYLRGELNRNDMFQRLNSAIHDFAKRQGNWFRRMERHGIEIQWLAGAADPLAQASGLVQQAFARQSREASSCLSVL